MSNTLESEFCIEALKQALRPYGKPEIFNTDQGSQFTSRGFVGILESHGIQVSMDGRGRAQDNIFIERLWRPLKYHVVYLHAFDSGSGLRQGLRQWVDFYNQERSHQTLDNLTPDEVYYVVPHPLPWQPEVSHEPLLPQSLFSIPRLSNLMGPPPRRWSQEAP